MSGQDVTAHRGFLEAPSLAPNAVPPCTDASARRWPPGLANELKFRILHFTPSWFAVNMGTGISAILIHNLPFSFSGQNEISLVIFGINCVLFLIFLIASCVRYAVWPSIFRMMLEHNVQSLFLGTFAMGFATIVSMMAVIDPRAVTVAWALWWIDAVVSVVIAIGVPFCMFTWHKHDVSTLTAVWLLPIVSVIVAAAVGGTVAQHLPDPGQARLTAQISYILLGSGLLPALLVQALYLQRLTIYKLPPAGVIVSVFLPLGPCGQSSFALLQLARVGRTLQATTGHGVFNFTGETKEMLTTAVSAASVIGALLLEGLGFWWLVLALLTIGRTASKGGFPFNMGWWGFTFPLGTVASAASALGTDLDSFAWKVIGTILSVSVVLLWLYVAARTAVESVRGSVFSAPCLGESGQPPKKKSNRGTVTPNSELSV